jgi:hypothetical protein
MSLFKPGLPRSGRLLHCQGWEFAQIFLRDIFTGPDGFFAALFPTKQRCCPLPALEKAEKTIMDREYLLQDKCPGTSSLAGIKPSWLWGENNKKRSGPCLLTRKLRREDGDKPHYSL